MPPGDKYHQLRNRVKHVSQAIIGMDSKSALAATEAAGLKYRVVRMDGEGMVCTRDVRMDRIGAVIENGIVVDTENR